MPLQLLHHCKLQLKLQSADTKACGTIQSLRYYKYDLQPSSSSSNGRQATVEDILINLKKDAHQ